MCHVCTQKNIPRNTQKPHLAQCGHSPPFLCRSSLFYMSNPLLLNRHFGGLGRFSVTSHFVFSSFCIRPVLRCVCTYPLSNPHITSCLIAPPHSQSTHPKNPSRHPVTSLSQPCHKTCMSPHDNYMVVRAVRWAVI